MRYTNEDFKIISRDAAVPLELRAERTPLNLNVDQWK